MTRPASARRRFRRVIVPALAVLALAALWTGFWFYAASTAETTIAGWREREARLGRIFTCDSQPIGGFPFRLEVRCAEAGLELRTPQLALVFKAKDVLLVAQVYQPSHLITELIGPLTIAEPGRPAKLVAHWSLARASIRGSPTAPERVSIVVEGLRLDRLEAAGAAMIAAANRAELHARRSAASSPDDPIIDLAVRLSGATAPSVGSLGAQPLDADVTAVLRGLKDLALKPIAVKLKELQAAGGRLDVSNARIQQGESVAVGAGVLGLSPNGRLDGTMQVTVAGFERFIASLGGWQKLLPPGTLERATPALSVLERFAPALGGAGRDRTEATILALLGNKTQLEGRPAILAPLRFSDGAAFLGPIPLGHVPPLY